MESPLWLIVLLVALLTLPFLGGMIFLFVWLSKSLQQSILSLQESAHTSATLTLQQLSSQLSDSHQQSVETNQQSLSELAKIVSQQSVLLGTKDPLAYQIVAGANSLPGDGGTDPYTSSDGAAEAEAQAQNEAMEQALAAIMSLGGVPVVTEHSYPTAPTEGA